MTFSKQPQPFEHRTGKGVRIAIIDSGVNVRHQHIGEIAGGASVPAVGDIEEGGSIVDVLGHGTAVTAAIQEKAPDAEYIIAKLFHDNLRTSTDALINAIGWAIEQRVDLINLSLGVRDLRSADRFRNVVEVGLKHGVVLIAALEADGQRCLPGSLPGVLGVGLDWECDRDSYRFVDGPTFYASGYPRSLPGVAPARNLHGVSFAVANMTGIIARACERLHERSPQAVAECLRIESRRITALAAQ